jgi:hypothetical protein
VEGTLERRRFRGNLKLRAASRFRKNPRRKKAMSVEEEMSGHGFRLSAGCSGKAAYTKFVKHEGKRAYISVTSIGTDGFPTTMEEPVRVIVYELRSGDELGPGRDFGSLEAYLDQLEE